MKNIYLSDRAKKDIIDVLNYTRQKWNKKTAEAYFVKIEGALQTLEQNPELLIKKPSISEHFSLYQVGQHWLICQSNEKGIYVLTVRHVAMNLFERLEKLQPTLAKESEVLSKALEKK